MVKAVYFYTDVTLADLIKEEVMKVKKQHGIKLSTPDASTLLAKQIKASGISLTNVIKPTNTNIKWKKLRLKL